MLYDLPNIYYVRINGKLDVRETFNLTNYYQLRNAWATVPYTERVRYLLETNQGHSHSKDDLRHHLGGGLLSADPDCTLETALRRLEKQGLIGKKLIERGWFRFYQYYFIGGA